MTHFKWHKLKIPISKRNFFDRKLKLFKTFTYSVVFQTGQALRRKEGKFPKLFAFHQKGNYEYSFELFLSIYRIR